MYPTRHMHVKNIDIICILGEPAANAPFGCEPSAHACAEQHARGARASCPSQTRCCPGAHASASHPRPQPSCSCRPSVTLRLRYAGRCGWRGAVAESGRRWRWRYLPAHNICRACASGRQLPPVALGSIDSGRTVGSLQAALPPAWPARPGALQWRGAGGAAARRRRHRAVSVGVQSQRGSGPSVDMELPALGRVARVASSSACLLTWMRLILRTSMSWLVCC